MSEIPGTVEFARRLIAIDTVNPPGNEDDCASEVERILLQAGFSVDRHPFAEGRTNLIARSGSGERPALCFTGHLDTVPLGEQPWRYDPFSGEIENGRLYGRGSADMKSAVAAMVIAATEAMQESAEVPDLTLVITVAEETGAEGAIALSRVPDLLGSPGAIIVGEPSNNRPFLGHKGALWLVAETHGVSAHGSTPDRGVNAIYRAARLVSRLESFVIDAEPHPVLGAAKLNVGTIAGGMNINSVPDRVTVGIDIRTLPHIDHTELIENVRAALGEELDHLRIRVDLPGIWTEPEDSWVQDVLALTAEADEQRAPIAGATYFTDASVLTPACGSPPTVILGPGDPALAHQTDEYCEVARIDQARELYAELIRRW